eukprot:Protomagalhaensia_sp_Gyna_25__970@NODE_146_length_4895_cov_17_531507_g113_i0_p4_GENE_NODE_146_length_4895_cov_17_531507_g113_i0NODE_146_length_4895_cov_17_531507_g113_i0_p4_ORF_typecomplete_len143_score14_39EMP70/PF02990_16/6_7e28AC_N/PF16214_5/0_36DHHC/PF01529_20/1_7DUF1129/PF06570_11/1_2_NODE_146_length_4895_cov_17_531507_g113_i013821810
MALLAGALPFGSVAVEAYFIYDSFWTHRHFFFYGFLLATLVLYICCTAASTITAVYILLNREDHKWHWYAFSCGASTGLYLFVYSIFYYHTTLASTVGFFHALTYWIYTILACLGVGAASGAVGVSATDIFLRRIYTTVKSD